MERIRRDIGWNHIRINIFSEYKFGYGFASDAKFSLPYPLKIDSDTLIYFFGFGFGFRYGSYLYSDIIWIIIYTSMHIWNELELVTTQTKFHTHVQIFICLYFIEYNLRFNKHK